MDDEFLRVSIKRYGEAHSLLDEAGQTIHTALREAVRGYAWQVVKPETVPTKENEVNKGGPIRYCQFKCQVASRQEILEVGVWWAIEKSDKPFLYCGLREHQFDGFAAELQPEIDGKHTWISLELEGEQGHTIDKAARTLFAELERVITLGTTKP